MSSLLTHLENWNRYSDLRDRLDAENALYPLQGPGVQPARPDLNRPAERPARREPKGFERFADGFETTGTARTPMNLAPSSPSVAQIRNNYFADGFSAARAPKLSLGNDNASLTFGAAAAPQDTSFTPTLADVELLLGGA